MGDEWKGLPSITLHAGVSDMTETRVARSSGNMKFHSEGAPYVAVLSY